MLTWMTVMQASLFAAAGKPIGGEWSRVFVLVTTIVAGMCTLLLAMAQTVVPNEESYRKGYEAGYTDGCKVRRPTVVQLPQRSGRSESKVSAQRLA